jgi:hypothetical protein
MRRAMRVSIVLGTVLGFATTAARADEPHVTGVYLSNRLNADGSQYQSVVHVVRDHDTFVVSWMDLRANNGQVVIVPTAAGVGMVEGRVFAVSQYSQQAIGLVLYRIEEDGRLIGRWTSAEGDGAAYSETLTRLPEYAPERLVPSREQDDQPGRATHAIRFAPGAQHRWGACALSRESTTRLSPRFRHRCA